MRKFKDFMYTLLPMLIVASSIYMVYTLPAPSSFAQRAPVSKVLKQQKTALPAVGKGLQVGMYLPDFPPVDELNTVEENLNSRLQILSWYHDWDYDLDTSKLRFACEHGYVPQITWETWTDGDSSQFYPTDKYPLTNLANGDYDKHIRRQLKKLSDTCDNRVIIRFNHEMDGYEGGAPWYPWQLQPAEYKRAWRHVVSISHEIDEDIHWLWSPNRGTAYSLQYYPGNEWVDYVGLTLNRSSMQGTGDSFAQFYNANAGIESLKNLSLLVRQQLMKVPLTSKKDG